MARPDIYQRTMIDVLTPELKGIVKDYFTLHQFVMTGCTREDGFAGQGVVPLHEMERHSVFRTSTERGTYNHSPSTPQTQRPILEGGSSAESIL